MSNGMSFPRVAKSVFKLDLTGDRSGLSGQLALEDFDILLTVHLSIIIVINQLNAHNLLL